MRLLPQHSLRGCATLPKGAQFEYPGLSDQVRIALIEVLEDAEDGDMECSIFLERIEGAVQKVSEACGTAILRAVKEQCRQSRQQVDDYCAAEANRTTCVVLTMYPEKGEDGKYAHRELFRKSGHCSDNCNCHLHVPVVESEKACRRQNYPYQCHSPEGEISEATRRGARMCTADFNMSGFGNTVYFGGEGFSGVASFDRTSLDPRDPELRSAEAKLYLGSSELSEQERKYLIRAKRYCRVPKPAEPPRPPVYK